ncbi:MAG TPA: hypothetical protein VKT30_07795 [Caulobacteraceae bacterium]|nr:hypothetical protein [Caulobacteraceae bacterium]
MPDTHNPLVLNLMVVAPTLLLALLLVSGRAPGRSTFFTREGSPVLYWTAVGFLGLCAIGLWVTLGPAVVAADLPQR